MPPIKKTDCSGMCKKCDMNLHEEAIQCTQCSCLYHLTCSELPLYKLVEYVKSRAKYICQRCTAGDDDYEVNRERIGELLEREGQVLSMYVKHAVNEADKEEAKKREETESNDEFQDVEDSQEVVAVDVRGEADGPQPDGKSANPTAEKAKKGICRFYKFRTCKHGPTGSGCPFSHPKKCSNFLKHGDKAGGCKKGRSCDLYHPPLCWSSAKLGTCDRKDCKYQHLQGTKRTPRQAPQSPGGSLEGARGEPLEKAREDRPTYAQMAGRADGQPPSSGAGERVQRQQQQQDFAEFRWEMKQLLQDVLQKFLERDRPSPAEQRGCGGRCKERIWS